MRALGTDAFRRETPPPGDGLGHAAPRLPATRQWPATTVRAPRYQSPPPSARGVSLRAVIGQYAPPTPLARWLAPARSAGLVLGDRPRARPPRPPSPPVSARSLPERMGYPRSGRSIMA